MEKDFDGWNIQKKEINLRSRLRFSEREIWFCALGTNVGFEQDGVGPRFLRPVLVLRKINKDQFLGLPLTSTPRFGKEYFTLPDSKKTSTVLLSQIKLFDAKRLAYCSGRVNDGMFSKIKKSLWELLNSNPRPVCRPDIYGAGEHVDPLADLRQDRNNDPQLNDTEAGISESNNF